MRQRVELLYVRRGSREPIVDESAEIKLNSIMNMTFPEKTGSYNNYVSNAHRNECQGAIILLRQIRRM